MITLEDKSVYNVFYPDGSVCILFIQTPTGNYFGSMDNYESFYSKIFARKGIWKWDFDGLGGRAYTKMYTNLNRVKEYCFKRAPNSLLHTYQADNNSDHSLAHDEHSELPKCKYKKRPTIASNDDIRYSNWLPLDFDAVKPSQFKQDPTTDDELLRTMQHRENVREVLRKRYGLKDPIEAMSGNGCYLLYRLPNWPVNKMKLIQRFLKSLSIDKKLINKHSILDSKATLSQHMKLWGTMVRKGNQIITGPVELQRPYRKSYIETLGSMEHVPDDFLEALEKDFPEKKASRYYPAEDAIDTEEFCWQHGVDIRDIKDQGNGVVVFILAECPFDPSHGPEGDGNAVVLIQTPGFKYPMFRCEHNSCRDMKWIHFKEAVNGYNR